MEGSNFSENKPKRKGLYFLLVIVVGLIVFLFFQEKKIKKQQAIKMQFIEEKNALRDDLDDLIDEHDNLLEQYGDLNIQLGERDSTIRSQISEIRNLIRTKEDLKIAKEKMEILKSISIRYLADIDSLYTINVQLHNENDSVIKVNKNINWKNYKLNKENQQLLDKVNKGSALEIGDVLIETLKYRNSGKEVETSKASKVITIRTTFSIEHNPIAEKGTKTIYLRFLSPNKKLLGNTGRSQNFMAEQGELKYSISKQFQYANKELPFSIDFKRRNPLKEGDYIAEVYIDGFLVGTKKFYLK
ncbi:MAG: hypothetical protein H8E84_04610 [Flavobacteriales bacterium]|nr:hypothetical protein [Flavobacteriales bacterium]